MAAREETTIKEALLVVLALGAGEGTGEGGPAGFMQPPDPQVESLAHATRLEPQCTTTDSWTPTGGSTDS